MSKIGHLDISKMYNSPIHNWVPGPTLIQQKYKKKWFNLMAQFKSKKIRKSQKPWPKKKSKKQLCFFYVFGAPYPLHIWTCNLLPSLSTCKLAFQKFFNKQGSNQNFSPVASLTHNLLLQIFANHKKQILDQVGDKKADHKTSTLSKRRL